MPQGGNGGALSGNTPGHAMDIYFQDSVERRHDLMMGVTMTIDRLAAPPDIEQCRLRIHDFVFIVIHQP